VSSTDPDSCRNLLDCLKAKKKARSTGDLVAIIEHEKVLIFKVKVKGFPRIRDAPDGTAARLSNV